MNSSTTNSDIGGDVKAPVNIPDSILLAQQVRASIVSNALQKSAIGLGVGVALSFGIFKSFNYGSHYSLILI